MLEVCVLPMAMEDLDGVMEIEKESFTIPWSRDAFIQELRDNRLAHYLVARTGDRVVAYGGMWLVLDEAHVTNIAVHPLHRKKGIATRLLEEMIRYGIARGIENFTLEVRASNEDALKLYKKFGFIEFGLRKRYYSDNNEDAVIMWLRI